MSTYNKFLLIKNQPITHAKIKNDGKIINARISLIGKRIDAAYGPRMQKRDKTLYSSVSVSQIVLCYVLQS